MSGFGKCIADVLRNDILSVPASTFVTQYPLLFNAASAVPTYMWQSLRDIWLAGTTTPLTNWPDMVTDSLGSGVSGQRTIDVITTRIVDQVDAPPGYPQSNEYGAEFAEIYVYFKLGGQITTADLQRIYLSEMRVRRLLDYNYRTNVVGMLEIPITDPSIDGSADRKCYWKGFIDGGFAGQAIKDRGALYTCTYARLLL